MKRSRWLVPVLLSAVLVLAPSVALAALSGRLVENVGVKTAKLNLYDTTDAHRIGGSYRRVIDRDYQGAGYTVYEYFFGRKSARTHKYPLEMYSMGRTRRVFTFVVNSSAFVTRNGTHVGTVEATLVSRYGSKVTKHTTPTYTYYRMGTRAGLTEFWCKSGKVAWITIARY
jgi:hypothetical protein